VTGWVPGAPCILDLSGRAPIDSRIPIRSPFGTKTGVTSAPYKHSLEVFDAVDEGK
jgi:hypothetical protein